MLKTTIIGLMLTVVALAAGCKKDNKVENNFKCKVNGETWRPRNTDLKYGREAEAHLIDDGKTFFVSAYQENSRQTISFAIFLDGEVAPGTYYLTGAKNTAEYHDEGRDLKFTSQEGYTGTLQILSLDKKNKLVTGRFSFKALANSANVAVAITDGEFNLQYNTY